jgi:hypothetical protein
MFFSTVSTPSEETTLNEAFHRHVADGGSDARSFYAAPDAPKRHCPTVKGAAAKPMFFSERGLFFNYTIDSAYFFPRSGFLLVFINQPVKAVGLDTMHGFEVMKIQPMGK